MAQIELTATRFREDIHRKKKTLMTVLWQPPGSLYSRTKRRIERDRILYSRDRPGPLLMEEVVLESVGPVLRLTMALAIGAMARVMNNEQRNSRGRRSVPRETPASSRRGRRRK